MGLGKIIQIIALLENAYSPGEQFPPLTICPTSLVYSRKHEIRHFAPDLRVLSVTGSSSERGVFLNEMGRNPQDYQVTVTSYGLLRRDVDLYEAIRFRYQVIDEAQYIKNTSTQSARAMGSLDMQTRSTLTGAPIGSRLGGLWSVLDCPILGSLFGSQFFKREYEIPIVKEGDGAVPKRLKWLIGPFVLGRVKKGILKELPDKMEEVVYSDLETEQKKLCVANAVKFKEKLSTSGSGQAGEGKLQISAKLTRLRQVCCDPWLCYDSYRGSPTKLKTCMNLVRRGVAGRHKMLLFSQLTSMLDIIHTGFEKEGIMSHMLTGATSKEEQIRLARDFGKDEVPVFLISLKAGGTGLNLTTADIVTHYDPWWNVAAQNQATDGTHRIGQDEQVMVYKPITRSTIGEDTLKLQGVKSHLAGAVVSRGTIPFNSPARGDILSIIEGGQEMEILMLDRSSYERGYTYTVLAGVIGELDQAGIGTEITYVGGGTVHECTGHGACSELGKYIYSGDKVNEVVEKMK